MCGFFFHTGFQIKKSRKCNVDQHFRGKILLRMTGLEPARRKHQNLNLARLPIPPHPHMLYYLKNRNTLSKGFRFSLAVKHRGFEPRTT